MATQNAFTLPANINFGATVLVNSSAMQTVTVYVDGTAKASFSGSGTNDQNLGTKIISSGSGKITVSVNANGKSSDLVSAQLTLTNKLNCVVLGSEDSTDADYNDAILMLNWPLG